MGRRHRQRLRTEETSSERLLGRSDAESSPAESGPSSPPGAEPGGAAAASVRTRSRLWTALVVFVFGFSVVLLLVRWELRSSPLQARYFTSVAEGLTYELEPGKAEEIRFPDAGPYDVRFGYHGLPGVIGELEGRGFAVEAQARQSPELRAWMNRGYFPIYREKSQAGLDLEDAHGARLSTFRYPERSYPDFESIPPLVWRTLLTVENRTLLDPAHPTRNPALEWRRLGRAVMDMTLKTLGSDRQVPGASTLATQIEKFRHSPGGVTGSMQDKLAQMMTASARAYAGGPNTMDARRRVLRDYLNSIPFAGIAGRGEVSGLGDALDAWFGADFQEVNELLRAVDEGGLPDGPAALRAATAYRQVLMLVLAVQRPSFFLLGQGGREALEARTLLFLDLMAEEGVITTAFRDAVRDAQVQVRTYAAPPDLGPFIERKAPDAVRAQLITMTGLPGLYDVDRLDMVATTTFQREVQDSITSILRNLRDPAYVAREGLNAFRLLERGDPAGVHYAFVLHELGPAGNAVRVRTDTYDGPFRLTGGAKLELGSTAKLRTLVSYLEVVATLHDELGSLSRDSLASLPVGADDRLSTWAVRWLADRPGATLEDMLDAALARTYSGSPAERFFTGGGVHTFVNFDRVHDSGSFTVRQAFENSVNLPFIRIMRDVVYFRIHRLPGSPANVLADRLDPRRQDYLERFADQEGRIFLSQFFNRHAGKTAWESLNLIAEGRTLTPTRLAWAFRSVLPDADAVAFKTFVHDRSDRMEVSEARLDELFRRADPAEVSLVDLGYLSGVHPLELWLVRHLTTRPEATRAEVLEASRDVRQEVYGWLFSTRRTQAQDQRIRSILEAEAFQVIHRSWQRLGYPFETLVPSYATAIGSSADRPDALTELVGILLADGMRYPVHVLTGVHLAEGTPFETRLHRMPAAGERVLPAEVARAVRSVMVDVVERGTAVRARNAVRDGSGAPVTIGAKTGTGDNRHRVYGAGGRILEDRAMNRTSTLVFFIGDRFYGSITAFVDGPEADGYGFTSSLPSQILRMAGPLLSGLVSAETQ